jgi:dipeptidyl aminopeptidase/acylaminoacyl peptidase
MSFAGVASGKPALPQSAAEFLKNSATGENAMKVGSMSRSIIATLSLLCFSLFASASTNAADASDSKLLEPATLLQLRNLSQLEYSAERKGILFVVSETSEVPGGIQTIWHYDHQTSETRQLSARGKINTQPRWCPHSNCLTFISDRDDKRQIYRLSMAGGEAEKVSDSKTDISSHEWSPSKNMLAYIANVGNADDNSTDKGANNADTAIDEIVTVVAEETQQLWLLDVASGEVKQLTEGEWRISSIRWTPDGESIVLSASSDVKSELEHDRLFILDPIDGDMRELWRPDREIAQIEVSPDGEFVSAIAARDQGPEPFDLVLIRTNDGHFSNLSAATIDRKILSYKWQDEDTLLAVIADGFESKLYEISLDTTVRHLADPPVAPGRTIAVGDNFLAFVGGTFVQPTELWVSDSAGRYRQATTINVALANLELLSAPEIIQYESFDGVNIEAALYHPDADESSAPYPLIVLIHGGPSSRWANEFRPSWTALLVSRGFAVLEPNIRGSTGRTHDFLLMNRQDLGGGDFRDIVWGVDYLVKAGIADPERLGIGGWSYGGYMAAWAVTQTDRFKVAVSGAPVTSWISEYGTESPAVNRYDRALLGDLYDNMSLFAKVSPISHVRNAVTPTLLVCAENDKIDPIGQCWEFYRGLKQNHVASELVIYKGVGHSRSAWSSQQRTDSMERMLNWFQHYLPESH